jgi:hypothetical protein
MTKTTMFDQVVSRRIPIPKPNFQNRFSKEKKKPRGKLRAHSIFALFSRNSTASHSFEHRQFMGACTSSASTPLESSNMDTKKSFSKHSQTSSTPSARLRQSSAGAPSPAGSGAPTSATTDLPTHRPLHARNSIGNVSFLRIFVLKAHNFRQVVLHPDALDVQSLGDRYRGARSNEKSALSSFFII